MYFNNILMTFSSTSAMSAVANGSFENTNGKENRENAETECDPPTTSTNFPQSSPLPKLEQLPTVIPLIRSESKITETQTKDEICNYLKSVYPTLTTGGETETTKWWTDWYVNILNCWYDGASLCHDDMKKRIFRPFKSSSDFKFELVIATDDTISFPKRDCFPDNVWFEGIPATHSFGDELNSSSRMRRNAYSMSGDSIDGSPLGVVQRKARHDTFRNMLTTSNVENQHQLFSHCLRSTNRRFTPRPGRSECGEDIDDGGTTDNHCLLQSHNESIDSLFLPPLFQFTEFNIDFHDGSVERDDVFQNNQEKRVVEPRQPQRQEQTVSPLSPSTRKFMHLHSDKTSSLRHVESNTFLKYNNTFQGLVEDSDGDLDTKGWPERGLRRKSLRQASEMRKLNQKPPTRQRSIDIFVPLRGSGIWMNVGQHSEKSFTLIGFLINQNLFSLTSLREYNNDTRSSCQLHRQFKELTRNINRFYRRKQLSISSFQDDDDDDDTLSDELSQNSIIRTVDGEAISESSSELQALEMMNRWFRNGIFFRKPQKSQHHYFPFGVHYCECCRDKGLTLLSEWFARNGHVNSLQCSREAYPLNVNHCEALWRKEIIFSTNLPSFDRILHDSSIEKSLNRFRFIDPTTDFESYSKSGYVDDGMSKISRIYVNGNLWNWNRPDAKSIGDKNRFQDLTIN
jgi:hypothetical protein